jgi:hypothetical protein
MEDVGVDGIHGLLRNELYKPYDAISPTKVRMDWLFTERYYVKKMTQRFLECALLRRGRSATTGLRTATGSVF